MDELTKLKWKNRGLALVFISLIFVSAFMIPGALEKAPELNEGTNAINAETEITQPVTASSSAETSDWYTGETVNVSTAFSRAGIKFDSIEITRHDPDDPSYFYNWHNTLADDGNDALVYTTDGDADGDSIIDLVFPIYTSRVGTLSYEFALDVVDDGASGLDIGVQSGTYSVTEDHIDNEGYSWFYFTYYVTNDASGCLLYVYDIKNGGIDSIDSGTNSDPTTTAMTEMTLEVDYFVFQADAVNQVLRSEYRSVSDSSNEHRVTIEHFDYESTITVKQPLHWNFTSITPSATTSISSNDLVVTNTIPVTYEITWVSGAGIMGSDGTTRQPNYLAIEDVSNDCLGSNGGFEQGTDHFVQHSSNPFDSIAINSTIVSDGAFSGRIVDTDTSTDYLYISQQASSYSDSNAGWKGYLYVSFDCYIEDITGGTSTLAIEYYRGSQNMQETVFSASSETDRWFKCFLYLHPIKTSNDFIRFMHQGTATNTVFFIDNLKIWESSIEAYTNSQGTNTLKPTLRNLDGYSNDVVANNKINVTIGIRSDNSTLQSWNTTTDTAGQVTVTYTTTLTTAEHFVRVYSYDNTFSGDNGSQKTFFTPITAGYLDYAESKGNAWDWSEETLDGFTYDAVPDSQTAENGYISTIRGYTTAGIKITGLDTFSSSSYYNYVLVRCWSNVTGSISLKHESGGDTTMGSITASTWTTLELSVPVSWGDRTGLDILLVTETGVKELRVDLLRLVHRDTPNLREYDSYFYLSSENDTLSYKVYQDESYAGIYDDLSFIQKNKTVGSHNLTYVVFQDNDEQRVYLPSSSTTYTFTVSATAFQIEDDFLQVGDWSAHYTLETNKDRDDVSVYLMLNGSYVEFPDGTYSTKPGSIIFSRPSYGYYNFTRIAEYDSVNYTRDTWITVTSNARMTTFMVSGTDSSSDYVVVSWNTNKGTGTLYAYDNNSLIATDTSEGSVVITKSSTVGLHNLSFDVVVESRNFSFVADYTVSDWTVSVALSIYSSSSYYVSIDESHTVTVTVTRSDSSDFDGYVFVNGTSVSVSSGSGSFTVSSTDVTRETYSVTHVQDLTATNRTFSANDLTVTFDKLIGYLSVVNSGQSSAICVVTFNNSYDDAIVDNYEYAVYVNDQYYSTYTANTFTVDSLVPGTYYVELRNIRNQDNEVDTGTSTEVSFEITGPSKQKTDWSLVILVIIVMLVAGITVSSAWFYRRWKQSKSWLYGQVALEKQNSKLNFKE
ncbi:MAG: hypothetical protein ACFFD4_08210 [Candidatus Odinarchaeota archaeon]